MLPQIKQKQERQSLDAMLASQRTPGRNKMGAEPHNNEKTSRVTQSSGIGIGSNTLPMTGLNLKDRFISDEMQESYQKYQVERQREYANMIGQPHTTKVSATNMSRSKILQSLLTDAY